MSEEYQEKYFNEKFSNIEEKLDSISSSLKDVINDHEERIRKNETILQENKDIHNLNKRVQHIESEQSNCPITEVKQEQERISQDINKIRFFLKHPKMMLYLIVGILFLYGITIVGFLLKIFGGIRSIL